MEPAGKTAGAPDRAVGHPGDLVAAMEPPLTGGNMYRGGQTLTTYRTPQ